jgi:hypothetical protein
LVIGVTVGVHEFGIDIFGSFPAAAVEVGFEDDGSIGEAEDGSIDWDAEDFLGPESEFGADCLGFFEEHCLVPLLFGVSQLVEEFDEVGV